MFPCRVSKSSPDQYKLVKSKGFGFTQGKTVEIYIYATKNFVKFLIFVPKDFMYGFMVFYVRIWYEQKDPLFRLEGRIKLSSQVLTFIFGTLRQTRLKCFQLKERYIINLNLDELNTLVSISTTDKYGVLMI